MAISRTNFSVDPRITRGAHRAKPVASGILIPHGYLHVGKVGWEHRGPICSRSGLRLYVCKFRSKIFINKNPSKRSATIFVKVLQNNKIFYYFASMYITTGDNMSVFQTIPACSLNWMRQNNKAKLYRKKQNSVIVQDKSSTCKKVIFLTSYFCAL